jgi:hypothetical protein
MISPELEHRRILSNRPRQPVISQHSQCSNMAHKNLRVGGSRLARDSSKPPVGPVPCVSESQHACPLHDPHARTDQTAWVTKDPLAGRPLTAPLTDIEFRACITEQASFYRGVACGARSFHIDEFVCFLENGLVRVAQIRNIFTAQQSTQSDLFVP